MPILLVLILAATAFAQTTTPLWLRGYAVIPTPQTVKLEAGDVEVDNTWTLDSGRVAATGITVRTLVADAGAMHGWRLRTASSAKALKLAVSPGSIKTGTGDAELDAQAYRRRIGDSLVEITGNAEPGLFYGVQTLLQLLKRDARGRLMLPKGTIEDWPKLQLRFLHWDAKHNQDRIETLKRYLDWAARFKVNMIGFELEDKFEYPSNPIIGAPGAFTTAQLQGIVDYGLERFIQVVPVVQSPAHMAYVLKHQQFAHLRADANNYQSSLCDPRTYDLIFSMYDDVVKATRGVKYFYVSTDEVYYAGIESQCSRPYNPENRSLAWVEFVKRARDHLARHGRRILVWAEYPLLPQHVKMIPPDVIDGVVGEPEYIPIEKQLGMRQLAYVSMQGAEHLFPGNLAMETETGFNRGRLYDAYQSISTGRHWRLNPIGVFGAAWGDTGLHSETFWMGWSAVAQYGWNPGATSVDEHAAKFVEIYYGPRTRGLIEAYRMMQRQGKSWERTWETVVSRVRAAGYGNSYGKGRGTERRDMTLSPPPLPVLPDLSVPRAANDKFAGFLAEARARQVENDQLLMTLQTNFGLADRNQYNLEVFVALARFMGHHWRLLSAMGGVEQSLRQAETSAQKKEHARAVGLLVRAHNSMEQVENEGAVVFAQLKTVWEKGSYPKGQSVGGQSFIHVLDDTKDHWADRTADLGYLMQPESSIGLPAWRSSLAKVIQSYAKQNNVPVKGLGEERLEH